MAGLTDDIWKIIEVCWKANPGDRLLAKDVIERLLPRAGQQLEDSVPNTIDAAELADWRSFVGLPILGGSSAFPDDLDIHAIPPELKKEGSDWFAIFNPGTKRVLDVSLIHTLMHERCVFPPLCLYFLSTSFRLLCFLFASIYLGRAIHIARLRHSISIPSPYLSIPIAILSPSLH